MRLRFNEEKATQSAALLLKLRGGRMSYLKLIKLLYLGDRKALLELGRPITTDRYVSMDHGPVVSRVYALISIEPEPNDKSFWHKFITTVGFDVRLQADPSNDELSEAEEMLLQNIYEEHGHKSRWQLRDETHNLPEWQDPDGSSMPIQYADILRAAGKSDEEVSKVVGDLDSLIAAEEVLHPQ